MAPAKKSRDSGEKLSLTKAMVIDICERVAGGESTMKALADHFGDPSVGAQKFMRFLNQRGNTWASEMWHHALATSCEFNLETLRAAWEDLESGQADKEQIARQKLLWDAVRWLASKRLPERYGLANKSKLAHLTDHELIQLAREHGITLDDAPSDLSGNGDAEAIDPDDGTDMAESL